MPFYMQPAGAPPPSTAGSILLDRNALVVDLQLDALRLGLLVIDIDAERYDDHDERADDEIERILFHGALLWKNSMGKRAALFHGIALDKNPSLMLASGP